MTTWKDIIAINDTTADIFLEDLGLTILASSQVSLHEQFEFSEIANADPLKVQVTAGNIIINDGTSNLSIADGLNYIDYWGKYEYDSEQAYIEGFEREDQYLDYDDTYKYLDISNFDVEPLQARLDGTTTLVIELSGLYSVGYQINFHYFGNANTIQYEAIAELNDAEQDRTKTTGWTRYSDSRLTLTYGMHLKRFSVNDRIRIKTKASIRVENITIEYASALLMRIHD